MRLVGVKAILKYLGYSQRNHRAWHRVRGRYAEVIRYNDGGRPWVLTEMLDTFDQARFPTLKKPVKSVKGPALTGSIPPPPRKQGV